MSHEARSPNRTHAFLVWALSAVLAFGCHHADAPDDASAEMDAASEDDASIDPGTPPMPALGAQIDRAGRAAMSTLLIGALVTNTDARAARLQAYGAASDPAKWRDVEVSANVSITRAFSQSLATYDAIDNGLASSPSSGCRNSPAYVGPPSATSYDVFAKLLADDELFLDTSYSACRAYLSLEMERLSAATYQHTECGGRAPSHDVIDVTYSLLTAGFGGFVFTSVPMPLLHDGATAHADTSDETFPFFGPPH